jgi:hypothetical protein
MKFRLGSIVRIRVGLLPPALAEAPSRSEWAEVTVVGADAALDVWLPGTPTRTTSTRAAARRRRRAMARMWMDKSVGSL